MVQYISDSLYIQIQVRHARTHIDDGKAQFTDYEIELKTNNMAFTVKSSKVRRRYSDFVWLRNRLIKDTRNADLPSLPGKRFFGRFNKDFIKQRQKKLQDFLLGLVKNNVHLSHTALHLFLQTNLSAEDIDSMLDENREDEAVDEIIAKSECKARINGIKNRNRIGSKHDSGFSGEFDDDLDEMFAQNESETQCERPVFFTAPSNEEDIFSDGHAADIETDFENEEEQEKKLEEENSDTEENSELLQELTRLRLSSLPAPTPEHLYEDRFESSVEYKLSDSCDSDTSSRISERSSTKGSISDCKSKLSSQENIKMTPRKKKRRYSRQQSAQRKSLFNSNASLPEYHLTDNHSSDNANKTRDKLRRSKSFYDYNHSKYSGDKRVPTSPSCSSCKVTKKFGSEGSCTPQSKRIRRTPSFLSSTERTPVKRKISLNEYIIVGRNSLNVSNNDVCIEPSEKEKTFKTSL